MPRHWRVIRSIYLALCCAFCAVARADDKESQALTWLASKVSETNASMSDVTLFTITTGYHVLVGDPLLLEVDGSATERVLAAMKQVVTQGQWTNDQYATMCLLGAWTRNKHPGHPLVPAACDLSAALVRAYVGSNATTKALLILSTEAPRSDMTTVVPADIRANMENLALSALVSRLDAVPLTILLVEYIRRTPTDSAMARNWLTNVVAKVPLAWNGEEHCFRFKNSPHGAYRDTCIALILLGGFYGSGPVHSRTFLPYQQNEQ